MLGLTRRVTGFVVAFSLVAGLPVAAARAGCVCDHQHTHAPAAAPADAAAPGAPTAEECPMHRHGGSTAHARGDAARAGDSMRCACAGQAQALIANAVVAGVLPAAVGLEAPRLVWATRPSLAEALVSLADSPPAPPPRA